MALTGIHERFVLVRAPAKLNLFLELKGRRPDGYHELETVITAVSLFDSLRLQDTATSEFEMRCCVAPNVRGQSTSIPSGRSNLAWRALDHFWESAPGAHRPIGGRLDLYKRIPDRAGLGGGSSDAAAAIGAARQLWNGSATRADVLRTAARIGSDVPFFVDPELAVCRGRGEAVTRLAAPSPFWFVVIKPPVGLSTPRVFAECRINEQPRTSDAICAALQRGEPHAIGALMYNALQSTAERLAPEIRIAARAFDRVDCCGHQLSGSGTAYFGLFANRASATRAEHRLRSRLPDWFVRRCRSVTRRFSFPIEGSSLQEAVDVHH